MRYKRRVGTGFSDDALADLEKAMTSRKTPAVTGVPDDIAKGAQWVHPVLVAEVDFTEFTAQGHVCHGSFLDLRAEEPEDTDLQAKICGVLISNASRTVFPNAKVTKGDVARHYERIGDRIIALAGHRPLSLFRCPSGIDNDCFFQKHDGGGMPNALSRIEIEESEGDTDTYLYATRPESLISAAQMGSIEFHIWGARTDRLDRPDRLVFDLDPDEGLVWCWVRNAALELRDVLADLGLRSGAIVTGGKGMHVWVPLRRTRGWDTVKLFAKSFAHVLAERAPDRFTATMSKAKRKDRIFIDWLRNDRGATAIAPYALRVRPGAPVAVPVDWKELKTLEAADAFKIDDMDKRLHSDCPALAMRDDLQSLTGGVIDALNDLSKRRQ